MICIGIFVLKEYHTLNCTDRSCLILMSLKYDILKGDKTLLRLVSYYVSKMMCIKDKENK